MMAQLLVLLLGSVGDGEYFQLALFALAVVSVIYMVAYILLKRKRSKDSSATDEAESNFVPPTNLSSHP
jgi:hypothetical protein